MQDRRYLLSLEELLRGEGGEKTVSEKLFIKEELMEQALSRLDAERQKKVAVLKDGKKKLQSMGAGLLLQLAVQEMVRSSDKQTVREEGYGNAGRIRRLNFAQLLGSLEEPYALEYTYGPKGKPYLKNYPYYVSLSHSEHCVFCVIAEEEVGADIQYMGSDAPGTENDGHKYGKLVQRFFSEEEKREWQLLESADARRHFFYRLWCRKEAYGKLTGVGMAEGLGRDMNSLSDHIFEKLLIEDMVLENYQLAICKWKKVEGEWRKQ